MRRVCPLEAFSQPNFVLKYVVAEVLSVCCLVLPRCGAVHVLPVQSVRVWCMREFKQYRPLHVHLPSGLQVSKPCGRFHSHHVRVWYVCRSFNAPTLHASVVAHPLAGKGSDRSNLQTTFGCASTLVTFFVVVWNVWSRYMSGVLL